MTMTATQARAGHAAPVAPGMRRRRSVPRVLGGALMALIGMAVFGVVALRADPAVDVLTVARSLQAGARITDGVLSTVRIVPDPAMKAMLARDRALVVGRVAALPLAPGTVLTESQLADAAGWPTAGQSVIAVGVKTGRAPAGLSPGAAVLVVVVPPNSTAADEAAAPRAAGVVMAVDETDTSGVTVVTVQLPADAAVRIASATGDAALVLQSTGW